MSSLSTDNPIPDGTIYAPVERIDGLLETRNHAEKWMHAYRYRFTASRLKKFRPIQSESESLRIIDIACGMGYGSKILAQTLQAQVEGVDIAAEALEYARENHSAKGVEFSQGEITKIPFDDESFDVAVCYETIEHVHYEEALVALKELHRVLRPGGKLFISTPNRYFTFALQLLGMKNPFHFYEFRPQELSRVLKTCGFEVQQSYGQTLAFPITYYMGRAGKLNPTLFYPSRRLPAEGCMIAIFECTKAEN
jgi:2-polyprenyl-3-methyl-5-hydroxy-6-metoxy-1,4-benzoquinol methylase